MQENEGVVRNYVVISADGHCGANIWDYKPYLETSLHDEFDAWAGSWTDGWSTVDEVLLDKLDRAGDSMLPNRTSMSSYNWDSSLRLAKTEQQGIAAEVLFPNTAPPFYPSGAISVPSPRTTQEYELRLAGIRAHNRWLADFCTEVPSRRGGIAQLFLNNIDDAVAEVVWAREHGLMGVLLPSDHLLNMVNLYYPEYDRLWATCADLDMPVVRHGLTISESATAGGPSAPISGLFESYFFAQRGIDHLVLSGVFERFGALKFVVTEANVAWVVAYANKLDAFVHDAKAPGTIVNSFCTDQLRSMSLLPSEYIQRNCFFGSFLSDLDLAARHEVSIERIMWGSDFPHREGTCPFTKEALRANFAGLTEFEVRQMTSRTAAACYGFDLDVLQNVADRIGPAVDEIATPLSVEDYPSYPSETVCVTFAATFNGND